MKQLSILFLSIWFSSVLAHDPDRAFFTFSYEATHIKVKAEFPWTLRNAVCRSFPEAMESRDSVIIHQAFENYFRAHFKLIDDAGEELAFIRWESLPADGHTHSGNFDWYFQKGKLVEIVNTLMFELYSEQRNFHFLPHKEQALVSHRGQPRLRVQTENYSHSWIFIGIGGIMIIGALSFWHYRKTTWHDFA